MTYDFLESLYEDIKRMLANIVIKRYDLARENETLESARNFEIYLACVNGTQTFYTFTSYERSILEKYLSPAEVGEALRDRTAIPERFRADIIRDQRQFIIDHYVETNEYYRMLNGQQPMDQLFHIKVTGFPEIDPDTPIEDLSIEQISFLELNGELDKIKEQYPDFEYLNYLGANRIDLIEARLAKPFEILRLGAPSNNRVLESFNTEYYGARRYVMANIYNRSLMASKELYDPVVGILMLGLAVRNTLVPTEYDYLNYEEILNAILKSYGMLQYFERFPFTYKRRLVLALDNLLAVKGTDGVLIDVCKLFSFDNFIANRYYLMKTHAKDADGNIIFDEDPEKAFDLQFVKAKIAERDIDTQEENLESYENVINNDYLWQLSPEEKEKLLNEEFNLMMSKYVDIEAAYDVTALTFEVCCFINLLTYARTNLQKVRCTNMYASSGYSTVFTMIVFLLAGLAYRSNFDGNIIYEPDLMAEVMRFNYDDIEDELRAIIDKYELLIDKDVGTKIVPDFDPTLDKPNGILNDSQILEIYLNNRNLYEAIEHEMATTDDIRHFEALSNLKNLLYFSAQQKASFQKSTGEAANTYFDMLKDLDPKLTAKLESIKEEYELNNLLLYVLEKLEDLFSSNELKYLFLNTPNTYVTLVSKYLRTAINVFKASSVQLRSINVFFYLGDHDPVRVLDYKVKHQTIGIPENVHVKEELGVHKTIILEDFVSTGDKIYTDTRYFK